MKVLLSVCLLLCLALSVNSVRVRTHTKSQSATSQGWQTYVDQNLLGAGMVGGAIISNTNGGVWAYKNLNLKGAEATQLINQFKNPSTASSQGIVVNGQKYYTLKADGSSMYGKLGAGGIVVVKTNKAIIIATYDQKLQPGAASNVVEKLGDYLREQNY